MPDGSYSVSDIQDYFNDIVQKHETIAKNLPVQSYTNKIKNRIVSKIKIGYKLELLSSETMKLLGSINQDKDGEDVLKLESVELVSVHCNLVNNNYQQASKVYLLLYWLNNWVNSSLTSQFITCASFMNNAEYSKYT